MMMAADLGGPINKAAYAFSIAMLEAGNTEIMGAVMTSGMVPAVGVALAATIFKKKFNAEQRDAAKANYIMGLSFICEGGQYHMQPPIRRLSYLLLSPERE